jgi:hypothetical protein
MLSTSYDKRTNRDPLDYGTPVGTFVFKVQYLVDTTFLQSMGILIPAPIGEPDELFLLEGREPLLDASKSRVCPFTGSIEMHYQF